MLLEYIKFKEHDYPTLLQGVNHGVERTEQKEQEEGKYTTVCPRQCLGEDHKFVALNYCNCLINYVSKYMWDFKCKQQLVS